MGQPEPRNYTEYVEQVYQVARRTLKEANRAMLDVLLLVQDGESCVCAGCARCNGEMEHAYTSRPGHEYKPPAPCLGCQVDAAIKLASGE